MSAAARLACAAAVAIAVSGCAEDMAAARAMPMPWGQSVTVDCRGERTMVIDFIESPRAARVRFDGTTVTLRQVDAASDAKFTDGRFILYVNNERAVLEETGMVVRGPCRPR